MRGFGRKDPVEVALESKVDLADELALVDRARRGDTAAFGALVERYMRRAYHLALGLVGSPEDALDLSQDAFVRAFRARRSLESGRPFYPWYYQILRRLCFNFLRDRSARRGSLERAASWLVENAAYGASATRPDRAAELSALRERLAEAIAELPEHEREVYAITDVRFSTSYLMSAAAEILVFGNAAALAKAGTER